MRSVFGIGRLTGDTEKGFALEALGLHKPLALAFERAVDLTGQVGSLIQFHGQLPVADGNLEVASMTPVDLHVLTQPAEITTVTAVIGGNLGGDPTPNPKGDRISGSLAYDKPAGGDITGWLRLTAYTYHSCAELLSRLEQGASVIAFGTLESYVYKGEDRLQLAMIGIQKRYNSTAPKPPVTLYAKADPESLEPPVDAFTGAA